MKKITFSKELIIGLIGITALLSIYLLINFFKGIDLFRDGERYYVKFDNIGQLANASPIYLNGYKAGNVQNISYDFNNMSNVVVTIDVDKRVRIPQGSYAEVNNHMLGGSDISIIMGKSNNFLAPGDTIKGKLNKGIAGEMESGVPVINKMIPKTDSILTSLNTLLANPALSSTIENTEVVTEKLIETTTQLNKLLTTNNWERGQHKQRCRNSFCTNERSRLQKTFCIGANNSKQPRGYYRIAQKRRGHRRSPAEEQRAV